MANNGHIYIGSFLTIWTDLDSKLDFVKAFSNGGIARFCLVWTSNVQKLQKNFFYNHLKIFCTFLVQNRVFLKNGFTPLFVTANNKSNFESNFVQFRLNGQKSLQIWQNLLKNSSKNTIVRYVTNISASTCRIKTGHSPRNPKSFSKLKIVRDRNYEEGNDNYN